MRLEGAVASNGNPRFWPEVTLGALLSQSRLAGDPHGALFGVSVASGVRRRESDDGRPAASLDLSAYKVVKPGQIIMNALGKPHGSIGVATEKGITSPAYWVLDCAPALDPRFAHLLLRSYALVNEYQRLGKNQPPNQFDLSWEIFKQIRVPLPPLEEQRRIADFLDDQVTRIGAVMDLRHSQLELLEESRLAAMDGAIRDSGALLRVAWILSLGAVGVVVNPSSYFAEDGVPFIHGYNVRDGYFDLSELKLMSATDSAAMPRSQLSVGDVLIVRAGFPGRAAVVTADLAGGNCASVLKLRPSDAVTPEWLMTFFNSPMGRGQVNQAQYGAAQEVVNLGDVLSFRIPVPHVNEQRARLRLLGDFEAERATAASRMLRQVENLAEYKRSLISAAVSGEFDVSAASGRGVSV